MFKHYVCLFKNNNNKKKKTDKFCLHLLHQFVGLQYANQIESNRGNYKTWGNFRSFVIDVKLERGKKVFSSLTQKWWQVDRKKKSQNTKAYRQTGNLKITTQQQQQQQQKNCYNLTATNKFRKLQQL